MLDRSVVTPEILKLLQQRGNAAFSDAIFRALNSGLVASWAGFIWTQIITETQIQLALKVAYDPRVVPRAAVATQTQCFTKACFKCAGKGSWNYKGQMTPNRFLDGLFRNFGEAWNRNVTWAPNIAVRSYLNASSRVITHYANELESIVLDNSIQSKEKTPREREAYYGWGKECIRKEFKK